jgi:hypothetical protein
VAGWAAVLSAVGWAGAAAAAGADQLTSHGSGRDQGTVSATFMFTTEYSYQGRKCEMSSLQNVFYMRRIISTVPKDACFSMLLCTSDPPFTFLGGRTEGSLVGSHGIILSTVHRQNVEVTNAESTKRRTTKRRIGQNAE